MTVPLSSPNTYLQQRVEIDGQALGVESYLSQSPGLYMKPRRRRAQPEQALQTQVVKFLRLALAGNSWFGAVPLGGGGASRGRTLKRTGAVAGSPDMLVVNDGRAIWVELKAPNGVVSDAQLYTHRQLRQAGSPVFVCRSLDDVIAALQSAGVPMRVGEQFI